MVDDQVDAGHACGMGGFALAPEQCQLIHTIQMVGG